MTLLLISDYYKEVNLISKYLSKFNFITSPFLWKSTSGWSVGVNFGGRPGGALMSPVFLKKMYGFTWT